MPLFYEYPDDVSQQHSLAPAVVVLVFRPAWTHV